MSHPRPGVYRLRTGLAQRMLYLTPTPSTQQYSTGMPTTFQSYTGTGAGQSPPPSSSQMTIQTSIPFLPVRTQGLWNYYELAPGWYTLMPKIWDTGDETQSLSPQHPDTGSPIPLASGQMRTATPVPNLTQSQSPQSNSDTDLTVTLTLLLIVFPGKPQVIPSTQMGSTMSGPNSPTLTDDEPPGSVRSEFVDLAIHHPISSKLCHYNPHTLDNTMDFRSIGHKHPDTILKP
ncbi:hypothetical protein ARMGADRAFT_1092965 [Armillaria gallica]|uniref:Uncharacterized protein n=1 Tax=Armillaria gallica TaxID=47427 RepID=A0A2H3C988_ARMGA|nr:hypothetical protein ARMGADRAFT_1092965 [Armillaria gallica]